MKTRTSLTLAAAVLLSGITTASAAYMSHSSTMSRSASDTLSLSSAQRKTAWNDLHNDTTKQKAPSGFEATVGSTVPTTLNIEPIPSKAARDVASLQPYDFAMVQGKLVIVNPSDKKIADVITG